MKIICMGRVWKGQSGMVYSERGICPTLYAKGTGKTGGNAPIVLVTPKSTNTQSKFIRNILITKTMEISKQSTLPNFPTSTSLWGVSPAKVSQLLENVRSE